MTPDHPTITSPIRIAIQGGAASFHELAAQQYFGKRIEIVACDTFLDVIKTLRTCDYGIAAVNNSLSGLVHEIGQPGISVQTLIAASGARVVDELKLQIEQCLVGLPDADLKNLAEIYSHAAALDQCAKFLDAVLPQAKRIEHSDTAGAAADVQTWGDPQRAAIASRAAAERYGLRVLQPGIQNDPANFTTFHILQYP